MLGYLFIEFCLMGAVAYFISQLNLLFECIEGENDLDNLTDEETSKVIVNGIACVLCFMLFLVNSVLLYMEF